VSSVVDLIEATVRVEQPLGNGQTTVGTGFIVTSAAADGTPRTILITADHVFARMPQEQAIIGFRTRDQAGHWRYAPLKVRIRDSDGDRLWTKHPTQDVAVVELPAALAPSALPASELPGERALETLGVLPGDEMMVLGYPRGLSANPQGFPILSAGKVASYPLSPADRYPTYLVNMNVHAGNSGGPVYLVLPRVSAQGPAPQVVVTGLLTQQIKYNGDRLAIGNVTQPDFISETISLMDSTSAVEVAPAQAPAPDGHAEPVSQPPRGAQNGVGKWWSALAEDIRIFFLRLWILARDTANNWMTPDPKRAVAPPARPTATIG
jgi:hypothetical protein